jgi:hypothetical protein
MVTIRDCHITGNTTNSGSGSGIRNNSSLTLINSTVSNNTGQGIASYATLIMINSTVSGNSGTGVYHFAGVSVITNSTITGNQPGAGGAGGVDRSGGRLTLRSTIISGNRSNSTVPDITGSSPTTNNRFISEGYNLIGNFGTETVFNQPGDQIGIFDLKIDPLGSYGGTTPTHRLKGDSPAIDKGNSFGSTIDQRGSLRSVDNSNIPPATGGDNSDIGAFEIQATRSTLSGTIRYGITLENQAAKFVSGVNLTVSGSSQNYATSDSSGFYELLELTTGGNYTVTPTKTGNINSITPFDATLVLRCVAAGGNCTLTDNQKLAADANNSNSITPFDATQILRFVAANQQTTATGEVGNWKFNPAARSYNPHSGSLTNENYEAILIGEINGSWTPPASFAFANEAEE